MKRTDIDRRNREIRKAQKKQEVLERKGTRVSRTPGDYIKELHDLFFFDTEKIYNIEMSEEILTLLMEMKEELEEKHFEPVLNKAVKKTKVKQKDEAIDALKLLLEEI